MLQLEVHYRTQCVEVALSEDVDIVTAPLARSRWSALLEEKPSALLLDLSHVSFVDLEGARFLLWSYQEAARQSCPCAMVTNGSRRVHRLLARLGVEHLLPLYVTHGSALAELCVEGLSS
jgi:anti-anti-sigma factor